MIPCVETTQRVPLKQEMKNPGLVKRARVAGNSYSSPALDANRRDSIPKDACAMEVVPFPDICSVVVSWWRLRDWSHSVGRQSDLIISFVSADNEM